MEAVCAVKVYYISVHTLFLSSNPEATEGFTHWISRWTSDTCVDTVRTVCPVCVRVAGMLCVSHPSLRVGVSSDPNFSVSCRS